MSASRHRRQPNVRPEDSHGFATHYQGCDKSRGPSGCDCWKDLVTAEHRTDGTPCWCHPSVVEVLGTDARVIVHRRLEC